HRAAARSTPGATPRGPGAPGGGGGRPGPVRGAGGGTKARGGPPAAPPRLARSARYAALWVRILRFCRGRCLAFLPGRWLGALTLRFFTVCEAVAPRRTR